MYFLNNKVNTSVFVGENTDCDRKDDCANLKIGVLSNQNDS